MRNATLTNLIASVNKKEKKINRFVALGNLGWTQMARSKGGRTQFSYYIEQLAEGGDEPHGQQGVLAKAIGVNTSTITGWKTGTRPRFEHVLRLAEHKQRDPAELFEMAELPKFAALYRRFLPDYKPPPPSVEDKMLLRIAQERRILEEVSKLLKEGRTEEEVVDFLKAARHFLNLGGRFERGQGKQRKKRASSK